MTCATCRWSTGASLKTAQTLRKQGYALGQSQFRHDSGLVCERHRTIAPTVFYRCGYEAHEPVRVE